MLAVHFTNIVNKMTVNTSNADIKSSYCGKFRMSLLLMLDSLILPSFSASVCLNHGHLRCTDLEN